MSEHLANSQLRQIMVRHKVDQQMLPEYLPPEAQNGKGADHETELKGFKRDFDVVIAAALGYFPNGATKSDFADYLTEQADRQGPTSAGPYLRATLLEIRNIVAPGYGAPKEQPAKSLDAETVINVLRDKHADRDSWNILDEVGSHLPKTGAAASHVAAALKTIGDDYQRAGDDFLAETADILADTVRNMKPASPPPALARKAPGLR